VGDGKVRAVAATVRPTATKVRLRQAGASFQRSPFSRDLDCAADWVSGWNMGA
jgi:hypothetical protein